MPSAVTMDVPLDAIDVGDRHRRDMGDLQVLADSMASIGLLQPIGVTAEAIRIHMGERRGRPTAAKVDGCPPFSGKPRDLLAGGKEYERARSVVECGAPNVVDAMDAGAS